MKRKVFLKLGWAYVFVVIIYYDIDDFIAKNIISSKYEVDNNVESAIAFITQKFNDRCMCCTLSLNVRSYTDFINLCAEGV